LKDKFYKVICDEINLVLLIKKLTIKDEQRAYFSTRKKLQDLDKPISIESYMSHVIKYFLHKADEFYSNLPEDKEDRLMIIKAVYLSIIEAYPPFDLAFVCSDLNNSTFMDDLLGDKKVADMLAERLGETSGTPRALKSIRTNADIRQLDKYLRRNVIGQDEAIDSMVNGMKLIASGLYKSGSFFFIGPTGVGKTELARLIGNKYSGKFWKINCAEYAQQHEYAKLIGSPPGYVGHSERSLMAEKAEESNRWVILFDEIEKAHPKFYDFLLSVLDDGTATDNMGRVLDFSESIFIFTSNQGIKDLKLGKTVGFGNETVTVDKSKEEITQSVKSKFPAEFMNRIDNYVFFNTLKPEHVKKIATLSLNNLPIKKHKVLLDYIAKNGYSEEYGARNIKRFIKTKVATVIADALLGRRLPMRKGDLYTPKIVNGELTLADLETDEMTMDQAAG
jgi:ATP-dependent Clp protease ATP-binding subunit ClpC